MYSELAKWWHLLSDPGDYTEEVKFFLPLLADVTSRQGASLLELGSGGGNNALHMKSSFASVTLVDLSAHMLSVSRKLNPDCEHLQGDMRNLRLERTFDAVFIHDAIDYMTTHDDLRQAIETAFIHCNAGGIVLIVPDHVRETFAENTSHGGENGEVISVRYLEWTYDPDESDTTYTSDYVIMVREGTEIISVTHDRHIIGLFALEEWLNILREVGFEGETMLDNFGRYVFIGRKS